MTQKSTLNKKLKAYSAVAGAIVAASAADAQVTYTDVVPDTTVNTVNGTYQLDLNNDGTVDFVLAYQQVPITFNTTGGGTVQYTYNMILAGGNNPATNQLDTAATRSANNPGFPQSDSHGTGVTVNNSSLWFSGYGTGAIHFLAAASTYDPATWNWGNWNGAVDQYVALKFDIAGQTHYGWVRLDVGQDANTFTVKDYAYDATPNTAVVTGITTSIAPLTLPGVSVVEYNNKVRVNLGDVTNANVVITDMTGRTIISEQLSAGAAEYDLSGQSAGIYVVTIVTETGRTTQKVSVR